MVNELNKIDPRLCGDTLKEIFSSLIFCLSILTFFIGFQFSDTMLNGWYQQFMPSIGSRQITDITFLDSLTGYAVTNNLSAGDTGYILKTTNGGDNWNFSFTVNRGFTAIEFVNLNTGYACGGSGGGTTYLCKTTNAGLNWSSVNCPSAAKWQDMDVLSDDTIWLVDNDGLTGGVYRTTNGGGGWDRQLNLGSQNPTKIYMFNARIGYIAKNTGSSYIRKTTNSGLNWDTIVNGRGFSDIFFVDSLIGWAAFDSVRKTTNGGINWQTQILPFGPGISTLFATTFSNISTDTIWLGGGRMIFPNSQGRGMIFRTINQGANWLFQIPDTAIVAGIYSHVKFVNKYTGWANTGFVQIHTTIGGDPVWLTPVTQISSEVPEKFKLFQNYPNPFNSMTKLKFQMSKQGDVLIKLFDMTGKEVNVIINGKLNAGIYEILFEANNISSGVYFYSFITDGKLIDTKKMVLIR
jgi:hypothetical protein